MQQPTQHSEQSGLAGAIRAEQGEAVTSRKRERDPANSPTRTELADQVYRLKGWLRHRVQC